MMFICISSNGIAVCRCTVHSNGICIVRLYLQGCRMFFCFSRPSCSCLVSTPHGIQCGWLVGLVLTGGQQCHCQCRYYNILSFHTHNCTLVAKMQCFLLKQIKVDPHPWGENEPTSRSLSTCHPHLGHVDIFFVSHFYMRLL